MVPPGTNAIIYENSDTYTSWALHGLNTWPLGPSKDHYWCHLYYMPQTSGYRVSDSADLFPQHCIAPPYSHISHVNELAKELQAPLGKITNKWRNSFVNRTPPLLSNIHHIEQRVTPPLPELQRVSNLLPTPLANNPTALRVLQQKTQTHKCKLSANYLRSLPQITWSQINPMLPLFTKITPATTTPFKPPQPTSTSLSPTSLVQ